jgi:hypothetical protein
VESLIVVAIVGSFGVVAGIGSLLALRSRPNFRAWTRPALAVTVGSIAILGFALLPPFALWLLMDRP